MSYDPRNKVAISVTAVVAAVISVAASLITFTAIFRRIAGYERFTHLRQLLLPQLDGALGGDVPVDVEKLR